MNVGSYQTNERKSAPTISTLTGATSLQRSAGTTNGPFGAIRSLQLIRRTWIVTGSSTTHDCKALKRKTFRVPSKGLGLLTDLEPAKCNKLPTSSNVQGWPAMRDLTSMMFF